MIKSALLFLMASLFTKSGCVSSIQPMATEETVGMDKRLAGHWTLDQREYEIIFPEPPFEKIFKDSILEANSCGIQFSTGDIGYEMVATMFQLDGRNYLQFGNLMAKSMARNEEISQGSQSTSPFPSHSFCGVRFVNDNTLILEFPDGDFIREQINQERMKIRAAHDELFGGFVITAPTAELQQFIKKYGRDERFYKKGGMVTLTRKR